MLIFALYTVGSASYNSTVTNHTEVLPVSVDIIGKSACTFVSPLYTSLDLASFLLRFFLVRFYAYHRTLSKTAARGCDGVIFSLVEALLQAGIITIPLAGQTITGGEILYKSK